jgi:hypothetical protein
MAWALSMGMIRSRESEFGRASSGPTSLRHRATGSKRTRQTRGRPGRQTGCRTSHDFADRGDRQIGKMASWTQAKIKTFENGRDRTQVFSSPEGTPADKLLQPRPCPQKRIVFNVSRLSNTFVKTHLEAVDAGWDEYSDGTGLRYEVYTTHTKYGFEKPGDVKRFSYGPPKTSASRQVRIVSGGAGAERGLSGACRGPCPRWIAGIR